VTQRFGSTVGGVPFARDVDRYLWTLDDGPSWEKESSDALAPIAPMSKLLQHRQIPLVLATYPQPWQVSADATPLPPVRDQYGIGRNKVHLNDRPFKKLASFAMDRQLPVVNATAAFRGDPSTASLFLQNDFHFSPKGHERYASVLTEFIVGNSVIH